MTIQIDRPVQCITTSSQVQDHDYECASSNDSYRKENETLLTATALPVSWIEPQRRQLRDEESHLREKILFDDDSDCTVSTAQSYSSEEEEDEEDDDSRNGLRTLANRKRHAVTFSQELVSQIWTRPRTPLQDIRKLFYSAEETQR